MNKICTSIEQSQKLIELGIDVNTADMYWWTYNKRYCREAMDDGDFNKESDIPAWSLTALLGLMPKSICIKKTEHSGYFYFLEWQFANDNSLRYIGHNEDCLIDIYSDHDDNWKDLIDTSFEMVCWLLENDYLTINKI